MSIRITSTRLESEGDLVHVRNLARGIVAALDGNDHAQTRLATAVAELGRNALLYGGGGTVAYELDRVDDAPVLSVRIADQGPGIADLDEVLSGGWRSQTGLGLGVAGARRVTDHFSIDTGDGGTTVTVGLTLNGAPRDLSQLAGRATDAVAAANAADPAQAMAQQNSELLRSLAEKELLMRELHHRTKNNLSQIVSMVRLMRNTVSQQETLDALDALEARLDAFLLIHRQLQNQSAQDRIGLDSYVTDLAATLREGLGASGKDITIAVDAEPIEVPSELATRIGLIMAELVMNAFKHAFAEKEAGRIDITLRREDDGLRFTLVDSGPPFTGSLDDLLASPSLGWKVIHSTARALHGSLNLKPGGGFGIELTVPLQSH